VALLVRLTALDIRAAHTVTRVFRRTVARLIANQAANTAASLVGTDSAILALIGLADIVTSLSDVGITTADCQEYETRGESTGPPRKPLHHRTYLLKGETVDNDLPTQPLAYPRITPGAANLGCS
jgi:hypothetical protein